MRIYIFVDMEGGSGIADSSYTDKGMSSYALGQRLLTDDVKACIRGCLAAGADAVIVRDGHGDNDNLLADELAGYPARIIQGKAPASCRMPGIEDCAGLILLGYHAMEGTPDAPMAHSFYSVFVRNFWLNGRKVGEIGIDAGIAADHGVPVILVTGDEVACREAQDWIPGVVACPVKRLLSAQAMPLMPLEQAREHIEAAARQAIGRLPQMRPLAVSRPVTLRLELKDKNCIPGIGQRPGVRTLDEYTFECTFPAVEQAFFTIY
jgi:D-amino peptidase